MNQAFGNGSGSGLTFPHGVHPEEYKALSCTRGVERMPFVGEYILSLGQHIGKPSRPVVKPGDVVRRGQCIAEADGFVSVALHSPVDGQVTAIELVDHLQGQLVEAIRIRTDPWSPQTLLAAEVPDPESLDLAGFVRQIQLAGIVGMGGAAFPAHVKFSLKPDQRVAALMINGCECEPFLTCDHRVMLEQAAELLDGTMLLSRFLKPERTVIAVEANKADAVALLRTEIERRKLPVEVSVLQVKYPQGAEKMMISAILGTEVPTGKLPIDIGAMVSNVGTAVAISDWFRKGMPLMERVVTVSGTAVARPTNVRVPIGTPMRTVVEHCGGVTDPAPRILLGGPMMGMVQKHLDVPVVKGTSGILLLTDREVVDPDTRSCIRCGRCIEACPIFLNPARLGLLARKGLWEEMEDNHIMDCFECGSCSFICPSAIPLVQSFRVAKGILREQKAREAAQAKTGPA